MNRDDLGDLRLAPEGPSQSDRARLLTATERTPLDKYLRYAADRDRDPTPQASDGAHGLPIAKCRRVIRVVRPGPETTTPSTVLSKGAPNAGV